jgi:hypothetical protein
MPGRESQDLADVRQRLEALRRSGLSLAAWSQANGIDGRSLGCWAIHERLRTLPQVPPPPRSPFQIVELVPTPNSKSPQRYIIRHGDLAVEVDENVDTDKLRRIFSALPC